MSRLAALLLAALTLLAMVDASLLTAASPADEILLAARLDPDALHHGAALILFGPIDGWSWLSSARAAMAGCGAVTLLGLIAAGRRVSASLLGATLLAATGMMSPPLVQAFAAGHLAGPALACAALAAAFGWRSPTAFEALLSGLASAAAAQIDPVFWAAAAAVPAACLVAGKPSKAVLAAFVPLVVLAVWVADGVPSLPMIDAPDLATVTHALFGFGGLGLSIATLGTGLLRLGRGGGGVPPEAAGALILVIAGMLLGTPALSVLGLVWLAAALAGIVVAGQSPLPVLVVQAGGVITGAPLLLGLLINAPMLARPESWPGALATQQAGRLDKLIPSQERLIATLAPSQVIDAAPVIPALVWLAGTPAQIARDMNDLLAKTSPSAVVVAEVSKALRPNNEILRAWAVSHGYRPLPADGPLQTIFTRERPVQ